MIGVQKYQFLAKSKHLTTLYACCSWKWIITNECVFGKYIHSLDFPLNIQISKNWTIPYFHNLISNRANFAVRGSSSFWKWNNYFKFRVQNNKRKLYHNVCVQLKTAAQVSDVTHTNVIVSTYYYYKRYT